MGIVAVFVLEGIQGGCTSRESRWIELDLSERTPCWKRLSPTGPVIAVRRRSSTGAWERPSRQQSRLADRWQQDVQRSAEQRSGSSFVIRAHLMTIVLVGQMHQLQ